MISLSRLRIHRNIHNFYRQWLLLENQITLGKRQEGRVYLRNFWGKLEDFDSTKLFLTNLIRESAPDILRVRIDSVFPDFSPRFTRFLRLTQRFRTEFTPNFKVWFSGENVRPPIRDQYDVFLGFEKDSPNPSNVFLPLWATQLGTNIELAKYKQSKLMITRSLRCDKKDFACIVISNPEPTRLHFLSELQKIGEVECYGPAFGRPIPNKQEILRNYRFNLCFENDLYPNYVTEKVFDSYEAECIPIWWGLDEESFLNDDAIINVHRLGFRESLERIRFLENNPSEQDQIREQPLLQRAYDFDSLLSSLAEKLGRKI